MRWLTSRLCNDDAVHGPLPLSLSTPVAGNFNSLHTPCGWHEKGACPCFVPRAQKNYSVAPRCLCWADAAAVALAWRLPSSLSWWTQWKDARNFQQLAQAAGALMIFRLSKRLLSISRTWDNLSSEDASVQKFRWTFCEPAQVSPTLADAFCNTQIWRAHAKAAPAWRHQLCNYIEHRINAGFYIKLILTYVLLNWAANVATNNNSWCWLQV